MPRPHVEFLKTHEMPWEAVPAAWARGGAERRLLSEDPVSGACSVLLRFPPDWSADAAPDCDEEFFVLDGEFGIGDIVYQRGDYAYLPRGSRRGSMHSAAGAEVMTFFEGKPLTLSRGPFDDAPAIERLRSSEMPWSDPSDRTLAPRGVGRKLLRPDAADGSRTWLLRIDAQDGEPFEINGVERHPCVEEMLLIEGDMTMTCGTMLEGDYFWRPPMIPHGPMGTRSGFLGLFRAKEGSFSTAWSEPAAPIDWDAPYRPILAQRA